MAVDNFKFNFQLNYSAAVEQLLYRKELPHHVIQFKSEARPFCLQCNLDVPIDNVKRHCETVDHLGNVEFEFYHKIFLDLPEPYQMEQIYFTPYAKYCVFCEVCEVYVTVLLDHIQKKSHFNKCKNATEYFYIEERNDFDYSDLRAKDVTPEKLQLLAFEEFPHPLIQQVMGQCDICLLCRKIDIEALHHQSQTHLAHREKPNTEFYSLEIFHVFFLSLPTAAHALRRNFLPASEKKAQCVFCKKRILYDDVVFHASKKRPCVFLNRDDRLYEESFNWEKLFADFNRRHMNFVTDYDQLVLNTYYPEAIMNEIKKETNIPCYIMQRQLENTRCLICRVLLFDVMTVEGILEHMRLPGHQFAASQREALLSLSSYHHFWLSQPFNLQMKQHKFIPYLSSGTFKCITCRGRFSLDFIITHLNRGCLLNKTKCPLINGNEDSQTEGVVDKATRVVYNVDMKEAHGPKEEMQEMVKLRSISPPPPPQNISFAYAPNLVNYMYRDHKNRRESLYIFQRRGSNLFYCFVCKRRVYEGYAKHVESKSHLRALRYITSYDELIAYHTYWSAQRNPFLQVNFNPHTIDSVLCNLCLDILKYNDIDSHQCIVHEKIPLQVSDEIQNFKVKYSSKLQSLYSKTMLKTTSSLVNTNMPIGQHWKGKIKCLLCRKGMLRNLTLFKEHLEKCDLKENRLKCVYAYHSFFKQYKDDVQLLQLYFLPLDENSALCANKHVVCYEKIEEHVKLCPLENIPSWEIPSDLNWELRSESDHEESEEETVGDNNSLVVVKSEAKQNNLDGEIKLQNADLNAKHVEKYNGDKYRIESRVFLPSTSENVASRDNKYLSTPKNLSLKDHAQLMTLYTKHITDRIYPKCNPPSEMYSIQKRSRNEFFCLICKSFIMGNVDIHLERKQHRKRTKVLERIRMVLAYHKFWTAQNNQIDQIYYNPHSEKEIKCNVCTLVMNYTDLPQHIELACAENKASIDLPSDLKEFEVLYDKDVMGKLYPPVMLEVSNSVLNSKMAVGQHFQGKISCLLCKKKLRREMTVWRRHLEYQCIIKLERIEIVKAYHFFFMGLSPEKQLVQYYFLPDTLDSALCSQKHPHPVPFKEIFEHIYICPAVTPIPQFPLPQNSDNEKVTDVGMNLAKLSISNGTNGDENKSPNQLESPVKKNTVSTKTGAKKAPLKKIKMHKDGGNSGHDIDFSVKKTPNSSDILNQIPNRMFHNRNHLVQFIDKIKCNICNVVMQKNIADLMHHLSHDDHLKKLPQRPIKFSYHCEICKNNSPSENMWLKHLDSRGHIDRCESLGMSRKKQLNEYECLSCTMVLYGDKLSVVRHQQMYKVKRERRNNVSKIVLHPEAIALLKTRTASQQVLDRLLRDSNEALNDDTKLNECLAALEEALGASYPNCKAHPFGSRVTGIGNLKSDLDVFVDIGDRYDGLHEHDSKEQQLMILEAKKLFTANRNNFIDILPITGARTPIIKVVHIGTDIDCDISFRNGLSVENTKYIRFCISLQPLFRPTMLLLKYWADIVNLKEEMCSYALCMLLIFQMQQQGYLLSVHDLRKLTDPNAPKVDGWDIVNYNKTVEELQEHIKITSNPDAYMALKEFFSFYSKFDFAKFVVCPLLGRTVPIEKFTANDLGLELPPEMNCYKEKVAANSDCQFRVIASMFVQDPFDLGHNLTKAVPKHFRDKLQKLCVLSAEQMSKI